MYKLMTTTKLIPDKAPSGLSTTFRRIKKILPPEGYFFLAAVLVLLSALAASDISKRPPLLTEGDIATADVVADSTFLFQDKSATESRRNTARRMQPLVLDYIAEPLGLLRHQLQTLFLEANNAHSVEQKEALRLAISRAHGEDVPFSVITLFSLPATQNIAMKTILPLVEERLREGVLPDIDISHDYPAGVLVRRLGLGEEALMPDAYSLHDLKDIRLLVSQTVKELDITVPAKQLLTELFESLVRPTLVPNYEVTNMRAEDAATAVSPVMYRVLKGEMMVAQGDRISREQQLKMQVFLQRKYTPFEPKAFLGIALCALLVSAGLLFSPSGKPGTSMTSKDFVFLAVLVAVFSLAAKGLAIHGEQIAAVTVRFLPDSLAFAVPVAGAAALSAQVFSARRYLVTGLLLAFLCTKMMDGGLGLFLFYFLSAMWSTWLTGRNASRQDVVWSVLPLLAGMLALWAGATLLQGGAHNRYISEMIAVAGGGLLSLGLSFALAPVVELTFGYTTRFRLMELLNLDQPLLRDLMINAPGTYHHSLIVSTMCEAGAKRVGAHSLLCRVAALYHDVGKINKSSYFIENQLTDDNPHDRLTPSISALLLISHVKLGAELGRKHRLGKEVTDIIRQHHGSSLIQYFYHKAVNQQPASPPNIGDFCYPGPKPQTREAALVMLADIVEASSRTLDEPTHTRLRQHIDTIMKSIYAAGQLDECELTFRDLAAIADSFQQVLRGLYHHRISYPDGKDAKGKEADPTVKTGRAQPYKTQPAPVPLKTPTRMAAYGGVPGELTPPRADTGNGETRIDHEQSAPEQKTETDKKKSSTTPVIAQSMETPNITQ